MLQVDSGQNRLVKHNDLHLVCDDVFLLMVKIWHLTNELMFLCFTYSLVQIFITCNRADVSLLKQVSK